ncbi:MAG: carboxypeptidase M32 [Anaerolineaceae bacterium]|nr:carboxypeptidase M32 [Anaerolineaceae bacterium]
MSSKLLSQLKDIEAEIINLGRASAVLGWDQQTYMPKGGAESRGETLAILAKIAHQKSTSPELGELLEKLTDEAKSFDPESDNARLIKVAKKDFDQATKMSTEWLMAYTKETAVAQNAWQEARATADFSKFQPHLEILVDLAKQLAEFFAPYDHVYDPLLDMFEPGMKTADVKNIFNELRPMQVELIQAISESNQVDDSFLRNTFPEKQQWDFGMDVMKAFGFDFNRGRQDYAAHPFTTSFGTSDVRLTTRIMEDDLISAMMSSMHECGHGLYEQGFHSKYDLSSLGNAASLAVHESQSRMFENLIGRSLPFWKHFLPELKTYFPAQLENISLEQFYRAINKVEPSMIRVEADEATYNMHIMLRMEIEIGLLEGTIKVAELPEYWNSKMEEYLGVVPANDAEGVLQDVHWSNGLLGYFPTYALGNLVSVQLWETMQKAMPNMEEKIEQGDFAEILAWLRENIHQHGRKYEPQELVERVTGSKITPLPYVNYLREKYSKIYGF